MKEFWVYTVLRLGLFVAAFAIVAGVWAAVTGGVHLLGSLVAAFLVSGVASFTLLNRQREAFAQKVDARARRASERFEQMRAKEDTDQDAG